MSNCFLGIFSRNTTFLQNLDLALLEQRLSRGDENIPLPGLRSPKKPRLNRANSNTLVALLLYSCEAKIGWIHFFMQDSEKTSFFLFMNRLNFHKPQVLLWWIEIFWTSSRFVMCSLWFVILFVDDGLAQTHVPV